jgi:hypothetical protein
MPATHSSTMRYARRWTETAGRDVVRARVAALTGACEICRIRPGESWSHRVARGRGGTWAPTNGLWTCGDGTRLCHGWLTANPTWAAAGGWCVSTGSIGPEATPVYLRTIYDPPAGGWWLLDDAGLYLHHDPDLVPLPIDPAERPDLYVPDGLGGHRPAHLPYEGAAA